MKLGIYLLSFNRKQELFKVISSFYNLINDTVYEAFVLDQCSTDGSRDMIKKNFPLIKLYFINRNLGVAGGRDYLIKKSNSDICVFLDDDSYFKNQDDINKISLLFKNSPETKFSSFKIIDIENNLADWPHPRAMKNKSNLSWNCLNYVGCGHAIRKKAYMKIGGYNITSHFYAEELELTYKMFNFFGSKMGIYRGDIEVIHLASSKQRIYWSGERIFYRVKNRMSFYLQNFSLFSFFTYVFLIGFFVSDFILAIKNKNLNGFIRGLGEIKTHPNNRMSLNKSLDFQYKYLKLFFGHEI